MLWIGTQISPRTLVYRNGRDWHRLSVKYSLYHLLVLYRHFWHVPLHIYHFEGVYIQELLVYVMLKHVNSETFHTDQHIGPNFIFLELLPGFTVRLLNSTTLPVLVRPVFKVLACTALWWQWSSDSMERSLLVPNCMFTERVDSGFVPLLCGSIHFRNG